MKRIFFSAILSLLAHLAFAGDMPFITNDGLKKYNHDSGVVTQYRLPAQPAAASEGDARNKSGGGSDPRPEHFPDLAVAQKRLPGIRGRVLWDAVPVKDARVELKDPGDFYTMPALAQIVVDEKGQFIIGNPPAGKFMIYAIAPSSEYWEWSGTAITIPADGTVDAGTLRLSKRLELLEPANGAILNTTTPTLRWDSFPGAVRYHVDVFNNQTDEAVLRRDTKDSSLYVTPSLEPRADYQWSVTAYNAAGVQIAYYSAWKFKLQ